jgi:2-methylcitrate dehydratase PrpD
VGFESFDEAARNRLAPLSQRVALRKPEPFVAAYPQHWGAGIALKLPDGRELTATRKACKGDPDQPLGDAEMIAKAELLLTHGGIEDAKTRRIVEGLLGLAGDSTGSSLSSVLEADIWPPLR